MEPYLAWACLSGALRRYWPTPTAPRDEEHPITWVPLWDLEAAAPAPPPPTPDDAAHEVAANWFATTDDDGVDSTGDEELARAYRRCVAPSNVARGLLTTLWVYMIYRLVRYAIDSYYHEEGWEITTICLLMIAFSASSLFGLVALFLEGCEDTTLLPRSQN